MNSTHFHFFTFWPLVLTLTLEVAKSKLMIPTTRERTLSRGRVWVFSHLDTQEGVSPKLSHRWTGPCTARQTHRLRLQRPQGDPPWGPAGTLQALASTDEKRQSSWGWANPWIGHFPCWYLSTPRREALTTASPAPSPLCMVHVLLGTAEPLKGGRLFKHGLVHYSFSSVVILLEGICALCSLSWGYMVELKWTLLGEGPPGTRCWERRFSWVVKINKHLQFILVCFPFIKRPLLGLQIQFVISNCCRPNQNDPGNVTVNPCKWCWIISNGNDMTPPQTWIIYIYLTALAVK